MNKIKAQAMRDMTSMGVSTEFIHQEKNILESISEGFSLRVDFRRFNGGHYNKSNMLLKDN